MPLLPCPPHEPARPGRRADVWSLGCTVLEMLTGQHPWPDLDNRWAAMFAIARSAEGPPRPAGISATALDFLDQCLQARGAGRRGVG
jgi:serine/threonine protein kinase